MHLDQLPKYICKTHNELNIQTQMLWIVKEREHRFYKLFIKLPVL